jgi:hypothetical protein
LQFRRLCSAPWLIGARLRPFTGRLMCFVTGTLMSAQSTAPLALRPMLLIGSVGALLLAGTVGLWAWYGTSVFFEVLRAGWNACF